MIRSTWCISILGKKKRISTLKNLKDASAYFNQEISVFKLLFLENV